MKKSNTAEVVEQIELFTIISIGTPLHLIANASFVISEIQAKP